jgi:hypothetical protein
MDNTLASILGKDVLPEEMLATLQEAFDSKIASVREEAEMSIRAEFAARYEHDKNNLVEAMDRMLTDVVKETEEKKAKEVSKVKEVHKRFEDAITESKKAYKKKMSEHIELSSKFITEQLATRLNALSEAKKACVIKDKKITESFEKIKKDMVAEQAARLTKIDQFVVSNMKREITEMRENHQALVEARVKFIKTSQSKLKETQQRFVTEAAKKVDKVVSEALKTEITQLHEDLERNRQNMFGRRIFEAVAAEFMASHLAEGTEIKKTMKVLEAKDQELAATKAKLTEAVQEVSKISRKAKLSEDAASRTKIMSELLTNLQGEKRSIMESMLETTKTETLRAAFDRLLPVVLNETRKSPEKKVIDRSPVRLVTGDKTRLVESQNDTDAEINAELTAIRRLAGITG